MDNDSAEVTSSDYSELIIIPMTTKLRLQQQQLQEQHIPEKKLPQSKTF